MDQDKLMAFIGRFVGDMGGAVTMAATHVGNELGLYEALDGAGPVDAATLADSADCDPRLVQEWLDQQAAAGYVTYDATTERYELPEEHAMALARSSMPTFVVGGAKLAGSMVQDTDRLIEAFRSDGSIPWHEHHEWLHTGVAEFFRPGYEGHLAVDWIPALSGVEDKLRTGASVADVGCGHGISSRVIAEAFPKSEVHGFDLHGPSIDTAIAGADDAGLGDRVRFSVAGSEAYEGRFDLICFFDSLHDMGDPVGVARHARYQLAPGGTVMLVEPFADDDKVVNHTLPSAKVYYGGSTFICTPNSLSQEVGRAMGAQAGEAGMLQVFEEAGFKDFRRAAETPFNLIFEARV